MDAKVIPFPRMPVSTDKPVDWIEAAFRMLYCDVRDGVRAPERMFLCYEERGRLYYLNLGFEPAELDAAVAIAAEHLDDNFKDQ
jgi:hypothetical protein